MVVKTGFAGVLRDLLQCLQSFWERGVTSARMEWAVASAASRTAHAYSRVTTSGILAVKAACSASEPRNRCTCDSSNVNGGLSDYIYCTRCLRVCVGTQHYSASPDKPLHMV